MKCLCRVFLDELVGRTILCTLFSGQARLAPIRLGSGQTVTGPYVSMVQVNYACLSQSKGSAAYNLAVDKDIDLIGADS